MHSVDNSQLGYRLPASGHCFLHKRVQISGGRVLGLAGLCVGSLPSDVHHLDALHLDALLQSPGRGRGRHLELLLGRRRRGSGIIILNWRQGNY